MPGIKLQLRGSIAITRFDCNYLRTRLIKVFTVQTIVGMFVYMQNIRHLPPLVAFLHSNIHSRNRVATVTACASDRLLSGFLRQLSELRKRDLTKGRLWKAFARLSWDIMDFLLAQIPTIRYREQSWVVTYMMPWHIWDWPMWQYLVFHILNLSRCIALISYLCKINLKKRLNTLLIILKLIYI